MSVNAIISAGMIKVNQKSRLIANYVIELAGCGVKKLCVVLEKQLNFEVINIKLW